MKKEDLEIRINELEEELKGLKEQLGSVGDLPKTIIVPKEFAPLFGATESLLREYFSDLKIVPESGEIIANNQRYLLIRSDSMSHEFLDFIKDRYSDLPDHEAVSIGNNFLYDNGKVIGKQDALAFHKEMNLVDPLAKLSAGPLHFAFTGWANVEIFGDSNPTPDENYFLRFQHHNSWEAQSWIKAGRSSDIPVCTMNCGYSAGWCEESFELSLTTVEVKCEAKGDDACEFLMAPTHLIEKYVKEEVDITSVENFEIPIFFKRQHIEEELKKSIKQKELMVQEIHHRVKNNLQVISSLLRLQMEKIEDDEVKKVFLSTINRAKTMAVVHELIYQRKDFKEVSMDVYFRELSKSLIELYDLKDNVEVTIDINVSNVHVSLEKSIPLALILNEIVCNSFKHGLSEGGRFCLQLNEKQDGGYCLIVNDNGGGIDPKQEVGLGIELINMLVDQIDGDKTVNNSNEGLEYQICFQLED
ncbi:MAG: two-component sensor histidine kinase [Flavobacteriaceae bacterium]